MNQILHRCFSGEFLASKNCQTYSDYVTASSISSPNQVEIAAVEVTLKAWTPYCWWLQLTEPQFCCYMYVHVHTCNATSA